MKWPIIAGLLAGFTLLSGAALSGWQQAQPTTTPATKPKIRYSIRQSGETSFGPSSLVASLNGKTSVFDD